jgi:hypothetical protein
MEPAVKKGWLFKSQHGFRTGYSCHDLPGHRRLYNGGRIDVLYFSKAFDLVPHDRLLPKIAASGVDSRVAVWIREFLLCRTQRVRVGRQLSEEVRLTCVQVYLVHYCSSQIILGEILSQVLDFSKTTIIFRKF